MARNSYVSGSYDKEEDFLNLKKFVDEKEEKFTKANRLFYLALPPTMFQSVTKLIKDFCMAPKYVSLE